MAGWSESNKHSGGRQNISQIIWAAYSFLLYDCIVIIKYFQFLYILNLHLYKYEQILLVKLDILYINFFKC